MEIVTRIDPKKRKALRASRAEGEVWSALEGGYAIRWNDGTVFTDTSWYIHVTPDATDMEGVPSHFTNNRDRAWLDLARKSFVTTDYFQRMLSCVAIRDEKWMATGYIDALSFNLPEAVEKAGHGRDVGEMLWHLLVREGRSIPLVVYDHIHMQNLSVELLENEIELQKIDLAISNDWNIALTEEWQLSIENLPFFEAVEAELKQGPRMSDLA